MTLSRRVFALGLLPHLAVPSLASPNSAAVVERRKAKLVVVGGGVGGLIAARSLARRYDLFDVILVESSPTYTSGFNSNLFLGGLANVGEINHGYGQIAVGGELKIVVQRATAIDRKARAVILADGARISYDRLLLSPGVELRYDSVPGWGKEFEELMPHAWQGSRQIGLLKSRLDRVKDGGVILILSPPSPYACPPGPYERASMMARALQSSGRKKSKIIILDAKKSFSMQGLFEEAWESRYLGMIEWLDPSIYESIRSVNPRTNSVVTGFETYRNVDLVNIIPAQRAGAIAQSAGLVDETGYCPIDQRSMRSSFDAHIYVMGDACRAGEMPKSAFAAKSQAEIAVAAIGEDLLGEPHTDGVYQSICWSELDRHDAIKFESRYELRDGNLALASSSVSQMNEPRDVRQLNEAEKLRWTKALISEMFEK